MDISLTETELKTLGRLVNLHKEDDDKTKALHTSLMKKINKALLSKMEAKKNGKPRQK